MLRWMCGHTSSNKIRNEDIRNKMGVASVVEKMRKAKLRWFEHVKRRSINASCTNEEVREVGYKGYEERQR